MADETPLKSTIQVLDIFQPAKNLDAHLDAESEKLSQQLLSSLRARYAPFVNDISALAERTRRMVHPSIDLREKYLNDLYPERVKMYLEGASLGELDFFKFLYNMLGRIEHTLGISIQNVIQINNDSMRVLTALRPIAGHQPTYGECQAAEEAGARLLRNVQSEFDNTMLKFDELLRDLYMHVREEYKRMRKQFLGRAAGPPEQDRLEEEFMRQMFGLQRKQEMPPLNPALELIDNNVMLTQFLMDMAEVVPERHEHTVPLYKNGVATGRTKTAKIIDESHVDDAVSMFTAAAHEKYLAHANNPSNTLKVVFETLQDFHAGYRELAEIIDRIMEKTSSVTVMSRKGTDFRSMSPGRIERQFLRINFLSLQPSADDVAPRNRMERDYSVARNKLLLHIKETVQKTLGMRVVDRPNVAEETEEYLRVRIHEAIELKAKVKEVIETEQQRNLKRNIQDDNEFYISKGTGKIGELTLERAPAPRIVYKDVVGASFNKAKEHVEEVVKVASHPHIMRLSAPRGDVKSNLLLIGAYGAGKTEFAKAVGSDPRVIGASIATADLLTAYMHESVKNVKRMYDAAADLRKGSRNTKPVGILLDEFDRLFSYGEGVNTAYDGARMEGTMQEMMDGVLGYEGVFLVAMTNVPKRIPEAILRRFKYVDVVGQLTKEERAQLLKQFLSRGLPLHPAIGEDDYMMWAEQLDHAPGDVLGKIADEVHFKFMHEMADKSPKRVAEIERTLAQRLRERAHKPSDREYLKKALATHREIDAIEIDLAIRTVTAQPQIQMQIKKSREVYRDADEIMKGLSRVDSSGLGFGAAKRSELWGRD